MTRWRVDFEVESDLIVDKAEKELVFNAPDGSHAIHLMTKRAEGVHAADELYLSAHVSLEGDDAKETG
jgi:hypothetical protein